MDDETKSERTVVFLTLAQRCWLEEQARTNERSFGWVVRGLIADVMKRQARAEYVSKLDLTGG